MELVDRKELKWSSTEGNKKEEGAGGRGGRTQLWVSP